MNFVVLICGLAALALTLPSNFDFRSQNQLLRYANYGLQTEGICAGYVWSKQLAQIVGNAAGLAETEKLSLSSQQLLDCTQIKTDPCYNASLDNIYAAMKQAELEGITTSDCYLNRPFSYPNRFCKRECHDGLPFDFVFYPKFQKLNKGLEDIGNLLKTTEKIAFMAIIKVDDSFNYYSPFSANLNQGGPGQIYEYRVAEIVGWKDYFGSPQVILRGGIGEQWGYNGYINLELSKYKNYIVDYYSVQLSDKFTRKVNVKAQSF